MKQPGNEGVGSGVKTVVLSTIPGMSGQKKKTKFQLAQEEYINRPSYCFMDSHTDNYWKENKKII